MNALNVIYAPAPHVRQVYCRVMRVWLARVWSLAMAGPVS